MILHTSVHTYVFMQNIKYLICLDEVLECIMLILVMMVVIYNVLQ